MEQHQEARGFERARELQSESRAEAANDYSSEEQARAAAQLVEIAAAHKKIDVELAGRAKAMLREMVDSGGDLDLAAVHALADEAERRYEQADMAVHARPVAAEPHRDVPPANDETQFFRVPVAEKQAAAPVHEVPKDPWEEWRAHLVASGAMDETGHASRTPEELGLTQQQLDYIATLQANAYMSEPQHRNVAQPRMRDAV